MLHQALPRLLIVGVCIFFPVLLSGCGTPEGKADNGKRWYMMNNCNACHGIHGDDGRAKKIAGIDISFGSFVRKLRKSNSLTMPSFPESQISREDAADIYAYLKSK